MKTYNPSYFVVMIDFREPGLKPEAIVKLEETRRNVIHRLKAGDYPGDIMFIHHIEDQLVEDVTDELIEEAEQLAREEEDNDGGIRYFQEMGL